MQYLYIHDVNNRSIYRYPSRPSIREDIKKGRIIGRHMSLQIDITYAENKLHKGQLEKRTTDNPTQYLDAQYPEEIAVGHFMKNHAPLGKSISHEEYEELKAAYELEASPKK